MAFEKGQSGNPGGKRQERLFHQALVMHLKEAGEKLPQLRQVAEKLVQKATEGDMPAIKELADRLDGKPAQQVNLAGEDGGAIKIVIEQPDEAV